MASDRTRAPEKRRAPDPPGSSNFTQDVVVLNDFGGLTFDQRVRTNKTTGKATTRYSLSIEAEPILNNLDGIYLGAGPAEAIRALLVKQSKAIGEFVKPATKLARDKMAKAYARGAAYAVRRYSGGRTGVKEPMAGGTDRIGVDSGRLSEGWFVRQNPVEQSFSINVPENRFTPETWGGTMASLQAWVQRFVSLVPALAEPRSILAEDEFVAAVGRASVVQKLASFEQFSTFKVAAKATLSALWRARSTIGRVL